MDGQHAGLRAPHRYEIDSCFYVFIKVVLVRRSISIAKGDLETRMDPEINKNRNDDLICKV